jgi:hypothetical protein
MRRPIILLLAVAAIALLGGCGDSSDEMTNPGPAQGGAPAKQEVRAAWAADPGCGRPQGASRWGCSVGGYRCQAVVVDRGWSVSCAKPGRSIAFTVPRG